MTITKIQTTHNPADVLTKHLPAATINSHLDRLCLQPVCNAQPVGTCNEIVARDNAVKLAFAQRQMTITLPWSFFVSLLMTILLCIH
eukprot:3123405-Amphidinium_carterae.3